VHKPHHHAKVADLGGEGVHYFIFYFQPSHCGMALASSALALLGSVQKCEVLLEKNKAEAFPAVCVLPRTTTRCWSLGLVPSCLRRCCRSLPARPFCVVTSARTLSHWLAASYSSRNVRRSQCPASFHSLPARKSRYWQFLHCLSLCLCFWILIIFNIY